MSHVCVTKTLKLNWPRNWSSEREKIVSPFSPFIVPLSLHELKSVFCLSLAAIDPRDQRPPAAVTPVPGLQTTGHIAPFLPGCIQCQAIIQAILPGWTYYCQTILQAILPGYTYCQAIIQDILPGCTYCQTFLPARLSLRPSAQFWDWCSLAVRLSRGLVQSKVVRLS